MKERKNYHARKKERKNDHRSIIERKEEGFPLKKKEI